MLALRRPVIRAALAVFSVAIIAVVIGYVQGLGPSSAPHTPLHPPHHPKALTVSPSLPLASAHGTIPGWLHTNGTSIVDPAGHLVRLAAVNWYGAEGTDFVPGGLAVRPYMHILRTIKYLGFNSIRLPFSNALVEQNPIVRYHVEANPQFRGRRALAILDTIIAGAQQVGLMVVLDNHRSNPGWTAQENGLWYTLPHYTTQSWIDDWIKLTQRYRHTPAVVGFDLRNEPHSNGPGLEIVGQGYLRHGATWGPFQGQDDPAHDWRLAAEQAGNAILQINSHALIIVEGTEVYPYQAAPTTAYCPGHAPLTAGYCPDLYWWGGNLAGARNYPVVLNVPHQLVYSPHEYGPQMHGQRWINSMMSEADWQAEMYKHWGYLLQVSGPMAAPVWVGEFGTPTRNNSDVLDTQGNLQGRWFNSLVRYLQRYPNVGWGYWAINGTSSAALDRAYGQKDIFGLFSIDWAHVSRPILLKSLHRILP